MYGWGDDTSTWNKPGAYKYSSAKAPYLDGLKKEAEAKGPKVYLEKKSPKLELVDPKGKELTTDSENPIIVLIDGTGSMQKRPAEIFDRSSLFYQTLSQYRSDVEMSFSVLGDANSDNWPVQIGKFEKGVALDDILKGLHAEGCGGPGIRESYELWAYFMNEHVKTPKAVSPFMFIMGDEKFYEKIDPAQVKHYLGDKLQGPVDAMKVWQSLTQKFDIYLLKKEYPGREEEICEQWREAIGEQKIIPVEYDERVVDVAMGLVAKKWGNYSDFKLNLSARQDSKAQESVMASLKVAPGVKVGEMKSKVASEEEVKKSAILVEGE